VLVVDRESDASRALVAGLRARGFDAAWAPDGEGATGVLARTPVDALVCPLRGERVDGFAVLAAARARRPGVCAIMVSDGPELALAVEAMRAGAWDVLPRPVPPERLLPVLERGLEHRALAERVVAMEDALDRRAPLDALTGSSPGIRRAREQVATVAPTRASVLVQGEPGTGKGMVTRALHAGSARSDGPFARLECGGLPAELFEGELCGVEAVDGRAARPGRLERAEGGTLVLAGVDALPPRAQVLLLRLLQEREYERVGGTRTLRADVRVLATTSADLDAAVREGRFREDLLWRLAVVRIALPPLRERREDIPLLVQQLLLDLAREHGRRPRKLTRGAMERLAAQPWPGNVAELKHVLEGVLVTARGRGPVDVSALPGPLRVPGAAGDRPEVSVGMTMAEAERALIEATLRHTGGDKRRAAAMLGIGLRTLYRKLDGYSGA
jgi:DNA-binding NtrC family response regulator